MRIEYIKADQGPISSESEEKMKEKLPEYFSKHLEKDLFAFIAKENDTMISTALLLIIEKPSNPHFMNGKIGNVLSVYTSPKYRRKGISTNLIKALIEYSKSQEIDYIELSATKEGYPLYKKLGFSEHHSEYTTMRYKCYN
jgi:GNAT superfamily N-acetyltransferase